MSTPTNQTPKIMQLPLQLHFYQIFMCEEYRDKVYQPYDYALFLKQCYEPEYHSFVHIELPEDEIPYIQGTLYSEIVLDPLNDKRKRCILWRKQAWDQAYEHFVGLKNRDEDNRRKRAFEWHHQEQIAYAIMRLFGYQWDEALRRAKMFYEQRATGFIVDILQYKEVAYYESKIEHKKGKLII